MNRNMSSDDSTPIQDVQRYVCVLPVTIIHSKLTSKAKWACVVYGERMFMFLITVILT